MSFWHCNCCKLRLQVALSFQQVLQHLRMLSRFSNHFSLIIRQCSRSSRAQRPSQRSQLTLLHTPLPLRCFILLRCICRCASCSAVALRRAAFASASNVLVCCRLSLPLSHQHPLLALRCRSLIMFGCCCSRLVPCCCAVAAAASVLSFSLFVVIMAISCALV